MPAKVGQLIEMGLFRFDSWPSSYSEKRIFFVRPVNIAADQVDAALLPNGLTYHRKNAVTRILCQASPGIIVMVFDQEQLVDRIWEINLRYLKTFHEDSVIRLRFDIAEVLVFLIGTSSLLDRL